MADLIDVDCYKEYKNIKSSTRDGKIQGMITRVSTLVENYCNRKFLDYSDPGSPKTEWFDGNTNYVELYEFPVLSVETVKISSDGGVNQTALVENTDYLVDLTNGKILTPETTAKFIDSYNLPYRSLEVEYTAGYTTETLPEDLKLAVLDLVHYYESDESTPTKSLLGGTIDNAQPYIANSFPPAIRRILDLYRYSPGI